MSAFKTVQERLEIPYERALPVISERLLSQFGLRAEQVNLTGVVRHGRSRRGIGSRNSILAYMQAFSIFPRRE